MADEGFTAQELVQACNKIIVYAGLIARVASIEEVRAVVSSTTLLVAALEGFLGRRLENVLRTTSSPADRAYNFTVVVDALSDILSCDLSHISGQRIVKGSLEDISNVLELLSALCQGRPLAGPPPATHADGSPTSQPGLSYDGATSPSAGSDLGSRSTRRPHAPASEEDSQHAWPSRSTVDYDYEDGNSDVGRSQQGYPLSQDQGPGSGGGAQWQQQEQSAGEEEPEPAAHRHAYEQQDQHQQHRQQHPHQQQQQPGPNFDRPRNAAGAATAASPASGVRVRRRGSGSSAGSGRRQRAASLHRAVLAGALHPHHHVPLSPIQEVSREGWENIRAPKEALSGLQSAEGGRASPHAGARASPRLHPYGSIGGASSIISIPSLPQDDPRRTSSSPDGSTARLLLRQQQQQQQKQQHALGGSPLAAAAVAAPPPPPSSYSEGTSTLLERALSQAEATLRSLGKEYDDFYYEDGDAEAERAEARGRRRARKQLQQQQQQQGGRSRQQQRQQQQRPTSSNDGASGSVSTTRASRGSDGPSGRAQQQQAFLRRAKRALLTGEEAAASATPSTSVGVPPTSASATGSGSAPPASKRSTAGAPSRYAVRRPAGTGPGAAGAAAGAAGPAGRRPRRQWSARVGGTGAGGGVGRENGDGAHEVLVRALHEGVAPGVGADAAAAQGRKLVQRAPEWVPVLQLERGQANGQDGDAAFGGEADALASLTAQPRPALQLNPDLEAKLRHLYRLMTEDPKQRAARAAVESLAVADDLLRHARRRALVERLANAKARRESALRSAADRLREQGREYEKRVEQLRLQRLAAEWADSQRSAQMRRSLAAEMALRDAFLEVLRGEKEVLLAEQRDARADASAAFPTYKRAVSKVEQDYSEVFELLERLLASERQQRVRADRESLQAQRHYNQLTASLVQDRLQELLGQVARADAATAARRSIVSQPKARRALVEQIRRLLEIS